MSQKRTWFWLALILIVAAVFRLYGLRWDDNISGYPHPDERHLANTMSRVGLRLPDEPADRPIDWKRLNDPAHSPLNPRRLIPGSQDEHYDLAYGTLPVYLYRLTAVLLAELTDSPQLDDYAAYGLIGRSVTALFSLLTVFWVYCLGRRIGDVHTALLGAAFLAVCVLHIQLSHFMTVDLLMSAMVTAGLLFGVRFAQGGRATDAVGMGALLGLSMACKFNGITLGAGIATAYLIAWLSGRRRLTELILYHLPLTLLFWLIGFGTFEYFALRDPYTYAHAIGVQAKMVSGETDWPYTRQYVNTAPYLFQLKNLILWGMGGVPGVAAVGGTLWVLIEQVGGLLIGKQDGRPAWRSVSGLRGWFNQPRRAGVLVLLGWALPYFLYTARVEVKFLRYMLPLVPTICLFAADVTVRLGRWLSHHWPFAGKTAIRWSASALVLLAGMLWATAYMRVYAQEHPWQAASRWFYQHVPPYSAFTWEAWGDPIPVNLPGLGFYRSSYGYRDVWMQPYADMWPQDKLNHIIASLRQADYITLATPRIYLSVARLPWRYPVDIRYYELLFQEQLGFKLVARFTAWPGLGPFEIDDLDADQSFYDYDHPLVLIFQKTRDLTDQEWLDLFADQLQVEPQFTRQGRQPPVRLPIPRK